MIDRLDQMIEEAWTFLRSDDRLNAIVSDNTAVISLADLHRLMRQTFQAGALAAVTPPAPRIQNHAPTIVRDIPRELSELQRERGYPMTRAEFKAEGYTDEQLCEHNIDRAAEAYATERQAA